MSNYFHMETRKTSHKKLKLKIYTSFAVQGFCSEEAAPVMEENAAEEEKKSE